MNFVRLAVAVAAASIALSQAQPPQTQGPPEGQAKDLTERVCSGCHEITVVTAEKHTPQQWKALVEDMVRRGAEASDSESHGVNILSVAFGESFAEVLYQIGEDHLRF